MKKLIIGFILGGIIFGSIGIYAASLYYAKDISYEPTDASWEVSNAKEALDDLYIKSQNTKILKLGTGATHSYDMKTLYPNDYQNFTVDDFVVEVTSGSNNSRYSCSECYLGTTNHKANSTGSYSLEKNYDSTTGIFTASSTISSSGNVTRYNGTFWSHSGKSNLTSTVYFLKNN